ncbi:MAG: hypothetical protein KA385_00960 [Vicinamibacteria bacterium]|nr:hypothetical protein [Vicinamibacteria bacterium]
MLFRLPRRLQLRLKQAVGKLLFDLIEPHRKSAALSEVHHTQSLRADGDRLSPQQLRLLTSYQDDTMDVEARKRYFATSDHTRTMHGIVVPLLKQLLDGDSSIRSTLNIGCNYAYMDAQLSKAYPQVLFQGVDVNPRLTDLNADLLSANLKLQPGYALDLLEAGGLKADLAYFSSTATAIRMGELKRYLRILSTTAKYVVFSEPIWPMPDGQRPIPTAISPELSLPVHLQRHSDTQAIGYVCYAHNYRALLEEAGFDVFSYRAYRPDFATLDWVLTAGQNRNQRLWAAPSQSGPAA